jgi:hypothetical protein
LRQKGVNASQSRWLILPTESKIAPGKPLPERLCSFINSICFGIYPKFIEESHFGVGGEAAHIQNAKSI